MTSRRQPSASRSFVLAALRALHPGPRRLLVARPRTDGAYGADDNKGLDRPRSFRHAVSEHLTSGPRLPISVRQRPRGRGHARTFEIDTYTAATMAGSPNPDLGALFDKHVSSEFEAKDADATMETMTGDPTVIHVPVLTGGRGTQELHAFYRDWFIPAWPDDVEVEQVSRTVGSERVVDELIIRFTHTCEMPFWLPGIAPTGCRVELPLVVVMGFDEGQVASEHIYWDQASLLSQIGLLVTGNLPIAGSIQAQAIVDPAVALNGMIVQTP